MTLAKPHADNRRNNNIVKLVAEVKLLLISQTNMSNIEIIVHTDNEELMIHCDNNKIKQVFINLMKNAIDAMESGGKIHINIKDGIEEVTIQFIDEGVGISPNLLKKIGEPFYTTKEKGTGIGLMVCFQIIESHKGTVQVQSEVNVGTTFTITLPKSQPNMLVI